MFESLQSIFLDYGYLGLFIASFLASTILPFGSEGILIYLVYKKFNIPALVLIASVGNFLGACTSFYIGLKGRAFVDKYFNIGAEKLERAEKYLVKYGYYMLLFTWIPVVGDLFTVAGGLMRFRFWIFSIFVFTGKFLRYLAVAYITASLI